MRIVSLDYAQEKAYKVLMSLGSSDGDLRDRLAAAIMPSFTSLVDEAERGTAEISSGLATDLIQLYERLSAVPPAGDEGSIQATLDSFDDLERERVAEQMVGLCIETLQTQGDGAFMLPELREP